MSKYEPLTAFLRTSAEPRLRLSFAEVERILGFGLPASARVHRPWWANQNAAGHSQVRGWADAGWRTTAVDLAAERVVFERKAGGNFAVGEAAPAPFLPSPPVLPSPHGAIGRPLASGSAVTLRLDRLSAVGRRLVEDYAAEAHGDVAAAVTRAVHEAGMARRARLVDEWIARAPRMPAGEPSVVDMIREDRDAR